MPGLVFPPEVIEGNGYGYFVPKLLGAYELEIQPFIQEICRRSYSQVINIGAADGYYAVGLAQHLPNAVILAYQYEAESRAACEQTARLNGVADRVKMRGLCEQQELVGSRCATPQTRPSRRWLCAIARVASANSSTRKRFQAWRTPTSLWNCTT